MEGPSAIGSAAVQGRKENPSVSVGEKKWRGESTRGSSVRKLARVGLSRPIKRKIPHSEVLTHIRVTSKSRILESARLEGRDEGEMNEG